MLTRRDRAKLAGRAAIVSRIGPVKAPHKPTRRMYAAPATSCLPPRERCNRMNSASRRSASSTSSSLPSSTSQSSSSSSDTEERSEDYVPLTSTLICSCPVRQTGPVSPRTLSTYTSAETKEQNSTSDLSLSEAPLLPVVVQNRVKRLAARVQPPDFTASSVRSAVPSSVSSEALSVQVQQKRAIRRHGPMHEDFLDSVAEVHEEVLAKDEEGEEEPAVPLQAQVLINIVRRLRDRPHEVTLEALSIVDWEDDNYQAVLEPLRVIYGYMEAVSTQKAQLRNVPLQQQQREYEVKMKEAIDALPSEKAMMTLVRRIASRPIVNAHGPDGVANPAHNALNRAPGALGVKEVAIRSQPVEMRRLGDSTLLSSVPAPCLGKEGILVEPATKARHARKSPNRSTSFSIIPDVEAEHEEIVESKEDMAPQHGGVASKSAPLAATATGNAIATFEKKARKHRRHRSMSRLGSSVSFIAPPDEEGQECPESTTEQDLVTRRTPAHGGKIADVPLQSAIPNGARGEAGGMVSAEANASPVPDRQLRRSTAAPPMRREHTHGEAAPKAHHKPRRGERFKGSRSCSFSEIEMDEAKEIKENEDDDRLARTSPVAKTRTTPTSTHVRRTRGAASALGEEAQKCPPRSASRREINVELPRATRVEDEEVTDIKAKTRATASAGGASLNRKGQQRRRHTVHRTRELSVTHIEEMKSGEIVEKHLETAISAHGKVAGAITNASPASQDDNMAQTRSSLRATRTRGIPKAALVPVMKDEEDDDNDDVTVDEPQSKGHGVARRKKRRQRRHGLHELSVSALPEEEAGEIRETDTDSLRTGTTTPASVTHPSRLTTGGSLSNGVRPRPTSGTAQRTLPPIGLTNRVPGRGGSASSPTQHRMNTVEPRPRAAPAVKPTR